VKMSKTERRTTHRLDNRLIDGRKLRFVPPVESPCMTTFNLRWWQHLEHEQTAPARRAAQREPIGGLGTPGSSRILASTTTAPEEWTMRGLRSISAISE
jgi:hypothetical protein